MHGHIVLVGTGLIGGSFILALRNTCASLRIVGYDRDPAALARATELGIVDQPVKNWADAMNGASLVVLAVPVAQTGAVLRELAPHLQPQTYIMDMGSTKADVVAAARAELGTRIGQFVPAHPIAGSERHGPEAAHAGLFVGKKVVVTPLPENPQTAIDLALITWRGCGAIVHQLTPEQHDRTFAAV
ncbi:MAG TPA: prephenate dehydrogenase/arogenate dehydrogenase family protein, partial [Burkholderiaceae bacterium]